MARAKQFWGNVAGQADQLEAALKSDHVEYAMYVAAMQQLFRAVGRAAKRCAKERAEWMDDPDDENYAEYHKPANEMYPAEVRAATVKELVSSYLAKYGLGNYNHE